MSDEKNSGGQIAWVDLTVADDAPIVLIGVGPKDVHVGDKTAASLERFRIDPCVEVLSKNLEVHLSRDRSVGWTFDDVSCRLPDPFEGRSASIPLRVTAVYQRHLDTWVMVMQHVSYGMPLDDVLAWARSGRLAKPVAPMPRALLRTPLPPRRLPMWPPSLAFPATS